MVDFQPLEQLRERFTGAEVDVLGNGPTVAAWTPGDRAIATVNAGMPLVASHEAKADLYWVQDERFIATKGPSLLPYVHLIDFFAANARIIDLVPPDYGHRVPVRMMGDVDWSRDPRLGVNHGYNVVFGLLQLLSWCRVRSVHLWGVGMRYWSTNPRYHQSTRGADVDLHRSAEQVILVNRALDILRSEGVEVEVHGPSALTDFAPLPQGQWAGQVAPLTTPPTGISVP
ncbi:MAG: hypothetical protein K4304_04160 [Propionicimonas sp.]